ncbi:hypothetical protein EC915_103376 [Pseudomonas sp. LP_7_YM]|nr:hypothetical protein [Pseudomonas sp. LP_7_YM]TDV67839.1 hypothetical protein EC915_103376 [Pseudomonas sp. LP_7_YM]
MPDMVDPHPRVPDVQLLDISGPLQVFASANVHAAENGWITLKLALDDYRGGEDGLPLGD